MSRATTRATLQAHSALNDLIEAELERKPSSDAKGVVIEWREATLQQLTVLLDAIEEVRRVRDQWKHNGRSKKGNGHAG